jgi:hypothetical protein
VRLTCPIWFDNTATRHSTLASRASVRVRHFYDPESLNNRCVYSYVRTPILSLVVDQCNSTQSSSGAYPASQFEAALVKMVRSLAMLGAATRSLFITLSRPMEDIPRKRMNAPAQRDPQHAWSCDRWLLAHAYVRVVRTKMYGRENLR